MTSLQDDLKHAKEVYRRWNESKGTDMQAWLDLLSEDVTFRSLAGGAPGMEFTQDCDTRADVVRYLDGLAADWQMVHYTPKEFIAEGDRVVMLGSCAWRHRKTGKLLETLKADFLKFKDGRVIDFLELYDTAKAIATTQP